jgi:hydroxymethylpyrimidine pyrophosphatase-like HAD family hydrolase
MKKLMRSRINAILSDYDGTLSPTRTIRSNMESIPKQLEGILWGIAQTIPVCIISSKDYHFIHDKALSFKLTAAMTILQTDRNSR